VTSSRGPVPLLAEVDVRLRDQDERDVLQNGMSKLDEVIAEATLEFDKLLGSKKGELVKKVNDLNPDVLRSIVVMQVLIEQQRRGAG
jgi:hypothetical protein